LPRSIDAILQRREFARSRFGVVVQTLKTKQLLYDRDGQRLFIPASNTKLFSTAAVLQRLGGRYRIRTSVYGQQTPQGWRLRVVGRGDPSLTEAEIQKLVQQIQQRGVTRVAQLEVDASYYQGDSLNEDWAVGDVQASFAVPISSLILNRNSIQLKLVPQQQGQPLRVEWSDPAEAARWTVINQTKTVASTAAEYVQAYRDLGRPILRLTGELRQGSTAEEVDVGIADPEDYFLRHFQQALQQAGIPVDRTEVKRDGAIATEIASVESAPLVELIKETNENSDNLYAEALLRVLGAASSEKGTTWQQGVAALNRTLTGLGVEGDGFQLVDGSGLARYNTIAPLTIVQLLQAMAQQPGFTQYRGSLAVAGRSGTLRSRFRNSPAQGIVQAKTGTLSGVAALSGYISPPQYDPLVFSIVVNQATVDARPAIDEIVGLLVKLSACGNKALDRR
jgi:D-alanyl-D-alanine carboxypeptidase/D-alanyl-D-alanine-endopeptidase (penicillin-binding protein 4)